MYVCNWANHLIFLITVNMNNDGYKESVKEISRDKYSSLVYSVFVSTPDSLWTYNGLQFSQDKVHFYEYCHPTNNNTHCVSLLPVCASSYGHLSSCVYRALFSFTFPLHTGPYSLSTSSSAELLSPVRLNLMEMLHLGLSIPRSFTLYGVHLWVSWIHLVLSIVEGDKYDSICTLYTDIQIN